MDERRYHGLDALRGGMMMLGIVVHAAVLYIAAPPPHLPFTTDRNTSMVMDWTLDLIHSFRMPTFFVLAGFFAALLVEKRGMWGTYGNRAARILAPFLAGMVTVMPLAALFMLDFTLSVRFGTHDLVPNLRDLEQFQRDMAGFGIPKDVFLAHLWFLYYLLYFYLAMPLLRFVGGLTRAASPRVRALLGSPGALIALSLATAAMLWPYPGAQLFGNFLFLTPHLPSLAYYGTFFAFGYLLHFHRDFLHDLARLVPRHAVLAAILFPLAALMTRLEYADAARGFESHLRAVVANAFCTWALVFLAIGCAMRFFDRASPWVLYTSQAAYWVFLVHLPVTCFVAFLLVHADLHALVKFAIVVSATTIACFASYHYWARRTWVSDFLNGRRFDLDWPWRALPAAASLPELVRDEGHDRREA